MATCPNQSCACSVLAGRLVCMLAPPTAPAAPVYVSTWCKSRYADHHESKAHTALQVYAVPLPVRAYMCMCRMFWSASVGVGICTRSQTRPRAQSRAHAVYWSRMYCLRVRLSQGPLDHALTIQRSSCSRWRTVAAELLSCSPCCGIVTYPLSALHP